MEKLIYLAILLNMLLSTSFMLSCRNPGLVQPDTPGPATIRYNLDPWEIKISGNLKYSGNVKNYGESTALDVTAAVSVAYLCNNGDADHKHETKIN